MDKKILDEFADIGITSQHALYNYILNNKDAKVMNHSFDLRASNEVMEFMALFLTSLGYKVVRLFFDKNKYNEAFKDYCTWICVFEANRKWYYYEPLIIGLKGKYVFNSYRNLTDFICFSLNTFLDKKEEKGVLKEIKPLDNFDFISNFNSSKNGIEIFENSININIKDYLEIEKPTKVANRKKSSNFKIFAFGFAITFVVCIFSLWLAWKFWL